MFRHHALIEHLSSNLYDFLNQISRNLGKPNKKFLRDGIIALIRAGRPETTGTVSYFALIQFVQGVPSVT